MKKFNCPSCGAPNSFFSNVSVYAVCQYCNSMIVRHDVDVEAIGTMAALPEDMSPLQIGTSGFYENQKFTIIGRMKVGWEKGSWNEWFLLMDDGRQGWICEAQGTYAVSFELNLETFLAFQSDFDKQISYFSASENLNIKNVLKTKTPNFQLGSQINIDNIGDFEIVDIKKATCLGSEGELPFKAAKGRKTTMVDLIGENKKFASLEIDDEKKRLYVGKYLEWDEMCCENLRSLEGWSIEK